MIKSKRFKQIAQVVDTTKVFSVKDAVELLKKCPHVKFDESVEFSMRLGVDPKKAEQQVRGTVSLPHGTGKKVVVAVFAKGEKIKEALNAGADYAGDTDLLEKVKEGWTDFNAIIATPDSMRELGKLGKVLGPKGLMPSPKAGNVTNDVVKAIKEVKAGKIEFKVDATGIVNTIIGKLSFPVENICENIQTLITAIMKAKPSSSKGIYMLSFFLSSSMGPGLKIDMQTIGKIS
jgi:large subunit ribosomal protein L1